MGHDQGCTRDKETQVMVELERKLTWECFIKWALLVSKKGRGNGSKEETIGIISENESKSITNMKTF